MKSQKARLIVESENQGEDRRVIEGRRAMFVLQPGRITTAPARGTPDHDAGTLPQLRLSVNP